ncbi:MAG: class I SAM-dependent methyltransferase [Spirulina sp. DLM2.Bin59]|nr:MAG: class I SAM-dependent methyltransferase [Spirulina sp. DLM2.Bin59]
MNLLQILTAASPLTFAEYMDTVLYHPEQGYYNRQPIGFQGDFFTSASGDGDFGELLAVQFRQMWQILGCPSEFTLLEMGAGEGETARDCLGAIAQTDPQCYAAIRYVIVEKSPQKRQSQGERLGGHAVTWQDWRDIPDQSLIGCCFSNELVDALPVHWVVSQDQQLQEVYLDITPQGIEERLGPLSRPEISAYFTTLGIPFPGPTYPSGYRTEVNLAALDWLQTVARKLKQGYLLTIDYGYTGDRYYHPQRHQGTLQCYFQHRRHNNPYVNLGEQDITAHVNFTALTHWGEEYGLQTLGMTKQGLFLMALGLGDRLAALSQGNIPLNQLLQRRSHLHGLIDPTGLGGFSVLLQQRGLTPEQIATPLRGFATNPRA